MVEACERRRGEIDKALLFLKPSSQLDQYDPRIYEKILASQ
jgi:hypothetical protein